MNKFNMGDKVKAISESCGWGGVKAGDLGIVEGVFGPEIKASFLGQKNWRCRAKDLELVALKWSIYNNDLPWEKLSNKQKGKLLLAEHSGVKFFKFGNITPAFSDDSQVYVAIKTEPVKPPPTMEDLFIADWKSLSSESDTTKDMMLEGYDATHILASQMIAKGWTKSCK